MEVVNTVKTLRYLVDPVAMLSLETPHLVTCSKRPLGLATRRGFQQVCVYMMVIDGNRLSSGKGFRSRMATGFAQVSHF